jgi:hypothetical protein
MISGARLPFGHTTNCLHTVGVLAIETIAMNIKILSVAIVSLITTTAALAGHVDETASNDAETYFRSHPENDRAYYLGHEAELAGKSASKYTFENETDKDLYVLIFKRKIENLIAASQAH